MCGIAGIVGATAPAGMLERMTARLTHRGPDDSGQWRGPGVELGHTRLSILDLSAAGHQPMARGPHVITYNGEIYNFRELRRELGGEFASDGDTEVLLRLYGRDGAECVHALRGMFAFAVWDAERRTLFAARDRLGIKPLYYRELPGGALAFASEIKALLELGRPEIDREALRDYFTYRYVPAPRTIFRGISQLLPGHVLRWNGRLAVSRYWHPSSEVRVTDRDEAVGRLGQMLREIVPEHTISDVPVGVFLSGGIDSTTVVAHLERARTFTLGIDVKRRDESPGARRVARHFDTEHREEIAGAIDLDEAVETVPRVWDEPFGDSSAWATYLVSRLARKHVTVALSGEGGDELFCGYPWYSKWLTDRSSAFHRVLAPRLPPFSAAARSLQRHAAQGLERYASFLGPFTPRQKRALLAPDLTAGDYDDLWHFRRHWREDLEPLKRLQWADLHTWLPGDLLFKVDRASMAWSLEVRPPLLDHRLVEFALTIDPALLRDVEGDRGKLVMRWLMQDRVPPGLFDQAKRGFNLPIASWVRRSPHLLRDALDRLSRGGILRRPRAARFTGEQTWMLLVLDRWMLHHGAI